MKAICLLLSFMLHGTNGSDSIPIAFNDPGANQLNSDFCDRSVGTDPDYYDNAKCRELCLDLQKSSSPPLLVEEFRKNCFYMHYQIDEATDVILLPVGSCFDTLTIGEAELWSVSWNHNLGYAKTPAICQRWCQQLPLCVRWRWTTPNVDSLPTVDMGDTFGGRCVYADEEYLSHSFGQVLSDDVALSDQCPSQIASECLDGTSHCLECDGQQRCATHGNVYVGGWKYCAMYDECRNPLSDEEIAAAKTLWANLSGIVSANSPLLCPDGKICSQMGIIEVEFDEEKLPADAKHENKSAAHHRKMILRITSEKGRCRLNIEDPSSTTLGALKKLIVQKQSFEPETAELVLSATINGRQQALFGDHRTILNLGLQEDGSEIIVCSNSAMLKQEGLMQTTNNAPTRHTRSTTSSSATAARKKAKDKKYQPFEEFLNDTDYNLSNLPLLQSYKAVNKNTRGPTKLPPTLTLKVQPYRVVDHIEAMNVQELAQFVLHWKTKLEMLTQTGAYLFGYYIPDPHYGEYGTRAVIEAVYEPPQTADHSSVDMFEEADENFPVALEVAKMLGLEPIGWIFTHLPREELITSDEVLKMARLQLRWLHTDKHYTGCPVSSFVTLTVTPKESLHGEPGTDAFMISDLGLAMVRDCLFEENPKHARKLKIRDPEPNELMPTVLETGKELSEVDTDWLLIRVNESAPKEQSRSLMRRSTFPKINRESPQIGDVKTFLNDRQFSDKPAWHQFADFHFLVYIGSIVGLETVQEICSCVLNKVPLSPKIYDLLNVLE